MEAIAAFFVELGGWNWFILAVILLVLESVIPGVHFMWFGIAAVVVGAVALAAADIFHWQWQLALFGLISFASIWFVRQYWRLDAVESDEPTLNIRGSQYVGQIVVVDDAILGGRGRVRVGDTVWTASGPDADKGEQVRVTAVDGTVLVVEPIA